MPPPHVNPEEATPEPKVTPSLEEKPVPFMDDAEPGTASESLYGEDLPPDFWDSDPVAHVDIKTATHNEPRPDEVEFEPSRRSAPRRSTPRQEVVGKLTDDPRFEVMQSLFPGQIVEWQDSEEVEAENDVGEGSSELNDADDPEEDADGLDLETDSQTFTSNL